MVNTLRNLNIVFENHRLLYDTNYILGLYETLIEQRRKFNTIRTTNKALADEIQRQAKVKGVIINDMSFEQSVPDDKTVQDRISLYRKLYLVALMRKNIPVLVDMADRGVLGLIHETNNRNEYISLSCNEIIDKSCYTIYQGIDVLEWKGAGCDREGNYEKTGHPSKWKFYNWRLPKAIETITKILWDGSAVPVNYYKDFRKIFFYSMSGGGVEHRYYTSIHPIIWNQFRDMEYKSPLVSITWNNRKNPTKITLGLNKVR